MSGRQSLVTSSWPGVSVLKLNEGKGRQVFCQVEITIKL